MHLIHKVYDFVVIAYNSARPLPHYNILKRSIAALMQDSLPLLTHANQGNLCMIWQQNQHILGLRFLQGVRQKYGIVTIDKRQGLSAHPLSGPRNQ